MGHSDQQEEVQEVTTPAAVSKSRGRSRLSSILGNRPRRPTPLQLRGKCTRGTACGGHPWLATNHDDEDVRRRPEPRILLRRSGLPWKHDDGGALVEKN